MKSFKVLELAIPRSTTSRVARMLSVSSNYVTKWRREPPSDDSPVTTGQRSILDRLCDLLDAVHAVNPKGTGLIVEFIQEHFRILTNTRAVAFEDADDIAATGAHLLTQAVEAVNSFNVEGCTPDSLRELIELRDATELVIKRVQTTMSLEDTPNA